MQAKDAIVEVDDGFEARVVPLQDTAILLPCRIRPQVAGLHHGARAAAVQRREAARELKCLAAARVLVLLHPLHVLLASAALRQAAGLAILALLRQPALPHGEHLCGDVVNQGRPQALREPHGVRVDLDDPVVLQLDTAFPHLGPDPVKDRRVQRGVPLAAKWHRQGHGDDFDAQLHPLARVQERGGVRKNVVRVASEQSDALALLSHEEARLVAVGQHKREAIQRHARGGRGGERGRFHRRRHAVRHAVVAAVQGAVGAQLRGPCLFFCTGYRAQGEAASGLVDDALGAGSGSSHTRQRVQEQSLLPLLGPLCVRGAFRHARHGRGGRRRRRRDRCRTRRGLSAALEPDVLEHDHALPALDDDHCVLVLEGDFHDFRNLRRARRGYPLGVVEKTHLAALRAEQVTKIEGQDPFASHAQRDGAGALPSVAPIRVRRSEGPVRLGFEGRRVSPIEPPTGGLHSSL
mmetsp:Transcript_33007/g.99716  ORF Transcript_33007/g.99716 Transcript_33007/m.99716 type:complete len:464 (+) Transcript_33007:366-1757(+)